MRLSTLSRYVTALGGRLEVRAAFPERTVALKVADGAAVRRTPRPASSSRKKPSKPAGSRKAKVAAGRAGKVATSRPGKVARARAGKAVAADGAATARSTTTKRQS